MDLIEQLLCDEYGVPHHVRRDIHMKVFDGLSAFDLMNADRLERHHIDALIEEVRLRGQSKAKPTNDSTPHQFELDFGDDDAS